MIDECYWLCVFDPQCVLGHSVCVACSMCLCEGVLGGRMFLTSKKRKESEVL